MGELGKKRDVEDLNYNIFPPVNEEYETCGTLREARELTWDRFGWRPAVVSNQSYN